MTQELDPSTTPVSPIYHCPSWLPIDPLVPHAEREPCARPDFHDTWGHRTAQQQQRWEERQQEDSRPNTERGLYGKFEVRRVRDPDGKHKDCRYFVLDPEHDPIARIALRAYTRAASRRGFKTLAADLTLWLKGIQ